MTTDTQPDPSTPEPMPLWWVDMQIKSITERLAADEAQRVELVKWIQSIDERAQDLTAQLRAFQAQGTS